MRRNEVGRTLTFWSKKMRKKKQIRSQKNHIPVHFESWNSYHMIQGLQYAHISGFEQNLRHQPEAHNLISRFWKKIALVEKYYCRSIMEHVWMLLAGNSGNVRVARSAHGYPMRNQTLVIGLLRVCVKSNSKTNSHASRQCLYNVYSKIVSYVENMLKWWNWFRRYRYNISYNVCI